VEFVDQPTAVRVLVVGHFAPDASSSFMTPFLTLSAAIEQLDIDQ